MVVQRFCRAYMESPPPAVFHYKYQSYKYERNTAGKSATLSANAIKVTSNSLQARTITNRIKLQNVLDVALQILCSTSTKYALDQFHASGGAHLSKTTSSL